MIPIPISILRMDTKINFNGYHEFLKKRDILSISSTGLSSRHSDRLNSGLSTYIWYIMFRKQIWKFNAYGSD